MNTFEQSNLRFNFGFLLEALPGTSREIEIDYPHVKLSDDVVLTPLSGWFKASRTTQGIYIEGSLSSFISADCARCLEPFQQAIVIELDELFFYPPGSAPPDAYQVKKDGRLDLGPLVREMSVLAIPMQPVCQPDCQGLCIECGQNLNLADCGCEDDSLDPRFAILKNLLDDLNN